MSELSDYDIMVDSRFTLSETAAIADIHSRWLAKLVTERTLPSAAYSTERGETSFKAVGLPTVFRMKLQAESSPNIKFTPMVLSQLLEFTNSNWDSIGSDSSRIADLWTLESLEKGFVACLFGEFIESVINLEWARRKVVEDPNIRGGIPTIRGTRIGVYEAANRFRNDGADRCLKSFPTLALQDFEAAEIYARAVPRKRVPGPGRGLAQLAKEGELRVIDQDVTPSSI